MNSPEKQKILRIVELIRPIDWIGFNSPEDTFVKSAPYQYGLIELLCDTTELIELFKDVKHSEESKLFNMITYIRYTPNQSVIFIRYGYLNKTLRALEAVLSGNVTFYKSSREIGETSNSDDLSFLKGSKVKSMIEKDEVIQGILKFKEPDIRELFISNIDELVEYEVTCRYRIGCSYDVLMHIPDMNKLVSVWLKKS